MKEQVMAFVKQLVGHPLGLLKRPLSGFTLDLLRGGFRPGRFPLAVSQIEQDPHQSDAIADGVMQSAQQGGSAIDIGEEAKLPKRSRAVERFAHQFANPLHQGLVQLLDPKMILDPEVMVELPTGQAQPQGWLNNLAAKSFIATKPMLKDGREMFDIGHPVEGQKAADHHEVTGQLHVKPGGIGVR